MIYQFLKLWNIMNFSHEGELTLNKLQSIIKNTIFTVNSIHKDILIKCYIYLFN